MSSRRCLSTLPLQEKGTVSYLLTLLAQSLQFRYNFTFAGLNQQMIWNFSRHAWLSEWVQYVLRYMSPIPLELESRGYLCALLSWLVCCIVLCICILMILLGYLLYRWQEQLFKTDSHNYQTKSSLSEGIWEGKLA